MHDVDVRNVDLNLLTALAALLDEGSVTGAARRLRVGQPAASHALARLRDLFGDPLLVRVGREMQPTPRAEQLREPLSRLLEDAERLLRAPEVDPSRTTRAFVLVCPDLLAPLVPRLVRRLAEAAPRARLEIRARGRDDARLLEDGRADLALVPSPDEGPGLVRQGLGTLPLAVVARRGHPGVTRSHVLSAKAWGAYPHVVVRSGHGGRSIVASALEGARFQRRVGVVVPTFLAALATVAETDLFFAVPADLAGDLLRRFDLVALAPPVPLPGVPVAAVWHERVHADPVARFFRGVVLEEIGAAIPALARGSR